MSKKQELEILKASLKLTEELLESAYKKGDVKQAFSLMLEQEEIEKDIEELGL